MTAITFFIVISIICIVALGVRDDYAEGAWRKSLDTCWTDRSCNRVMTCAHGGEWNISFPYDSMPAFQQAYIDGADAIKGGNTSIRASRHPKIQHQYRFQSFQRQYWRCDAL